MLFAVIMPILVTGCGSMLQSRPTEHSGSKASNVPEGHRVPVVLGNVTANVDQPVEVKEAVCRYLRDIATAEMDSCGSCTLVNTNATSDLLSGFGIDGSQDKHETISPEAALDVEVLRLEEKLGATFKIGFVSSQKKHAVAKVKVVLRNLSGGDDLASVQNGKSSKGAWGVITSVNREAMKGGQEEWEIDGSMIGLACAEALNAAIADLDKQMRFREKTLGAGIEKRLLRLRTGRGKAP